MKISLVVVNAGKAAGQSIAVAAPQFIIGRDPSCNLRPASAMISKQHCAVIQRNGRVYLKDFDSTNGTFLNDKPVKGEVALSNNDVLKVGPLIFRVAIEGQAPVSKPTPPPKSKTAPPDDDSAAAMLLSLEETGESPSVSTTTDESEVPGGSTIMEMPGISKPSDTAEQEVPVPPEVSEAPDEAAAAPTVAKQDPPKAEKKNQLGAAQMAAQSILDRYRKGQRKPPQ